MSDKEKKDKQLELHDESRVKVLSPGMMVYKRFIRNKLAIAGIIILAVMFTFSFFGGFIYPYGQAQVFKSNSGSISLDYAAVAYNDDLRFIIADGADMASSARSQFLLARSRGEQKFIYDDVEYTISGENNYYKIGSNVTTELGQLEISGIIMSWLETGDSMTDELKAAFEAELMANPPDFALTGSEYSAAVSIDGNDYVVTMPGDVNPRARLKTITVSSYQGFRESALASLLSYDAYDAANNEAVNSYAFRSASEDAIHAGQNTFEYEGRTFTLDMLDNQNGTIYDANGGEYADISIYIISPPPNTTTVLPVGFKQDIRQAIVGRQAFINTDTGENGVMTRYDILNQSPLTYMVKTVQPTEVIEIHYPPSAAHVLGTDANGMDVLARLIYGGRISLTVGFVVIILELLIGVTFGGISGYFGGWVDNLMMRFVDLFNTMPTYPLLIMIGSVMDAMRMDPMIRIYLLMLILGLLGWTGIARTVRGQILSLREQEFMVAAEASGLSVFRRIFKHLVPNVMPLLIVNATMGLGGIIITEATLSFLGLGVKYPLSSWGSMSNAATDINVMQYYPWAWLPAGLLIFVTVLGFNFVGDGLRDAFDPKMKR
jgi:peptide/nickel transport system permease protein